VSHERPESLLKSALEKIVYFEARATQLGNDLEQTKAERERLRADLGQASQREIELRRVIAELEVRSTRAHAEREEAASLAEALRRERAELIGKILEASRLSSDAPDPFDLASFIAELRSEVLLRRDPTSPRPERAEASPVAVDAPLDLPAPRPSHLTTQAQALHAQGRLTVSKDELASLERAFPFAGRSEETLFGFSVRELSAPDVAARVRAAERLKALAHPAAAPALATALHAETEPAVLVALLSALCSLAKVEALPVVAPQLSSPHPEVRIAALKALLTLDATQAAPHLSAAVKDPDASVRRRASLLALGLRGQSALELGETAIRDENAEVRALAALVLGASGAPSARPWLMQAMRDPDLRVRRSGGQALSRLLGHDVTPLLDLDDAARNREVRRLSQLPANPVKAKLVSMLSPRLACDAVQMTPAAVQMTPAAVQMTPAAVQMTPAAVQVSQPAQVSPQQVHAAPHRTSHAPAAVSARVAVIEQPAAVAAPPSALLDDVLVELRAAIRGQPIESLAASLRITVDAARDACGHLIQQGQVVRRGHKYFVA